MLTGADTLAGGTGDDTYILFTAGHLLIEGAGAGTDTVKSYKNYTLGTNFENLKLESIDAFNGTGNSLPNRLTGNGAANTLNGWLEPTPWPACWQRYLCRG